MHFWWDFYKSIIKSQGDLNYLDKGHTHQGCQVLEVKLCQMTTQKNTKNAKQIVSKSHKNHIIGTINALYYHVFHISFHWSWGEGGGGGRKHVPDTFAYDLPIKNALKSLTEGNIFVVNDLYLFSNLPNHNIANRQHPQNLKFFRCYGDNMPNFIVFNFFNSIFLYI